MLYKRHARAQNHEGLPNLCNLAEIVGGALICFQVHSRVSPTVPPATRRPGPALQVPEPSHKS